MKKIIITTLLGILLSTSIFAYNLDKYSYEDLYHEFSTAKGVDAISIGGFLIGLACLFIDDIDYDYIKGLQKLTILDVSGSSEIVKTEFKNSIDKINGMELLMEVSEGSDNLKILIERNRERISRLVIVKTGDPCIICIKCNMNTKDLNKFVAQFNKGGV